LSNVEGVHPPHLWCQRMVRILKYDDRETDGQRLGDLV
jgi:hypothetical protein